MRSSVFTVWFFILMHCCALGKVTETKNAISLWFEVTDIKYGSQNSLEITAIDRTQERIPGLVIRIPPHKLRRLSSGDRPYQFPLFLEPMSVDAKRTLDELLTKKFGGGSSSLSIFKPKGYPSASLDPPKKIGQKGGLITVSDAGIEGDTVWAIGIRYSPDEHLLEIRVTEAYY